MPIGHASPSENRCRENHESSAMNSDRFLTVKGDSLADASSNTVALRGYNIGGFLNMENFLTGFPSTESLQRGALLRALGEKRYELYFDRFMAAFFSDDDARYLASLGMNHVRSEERPARTASRS